MTSRSLCLLHIPKLPADENEVTQRNKLNQGDIMAEERNQSLEARAKANKERNRGTGDEVEILKMVIQENPILMQRVLDRIRYIRAETKAARGAPDGVQSSKESNGVDRADKNKRKKAD